MDELAEAARAVVAVVDVADVEVVEDDERPVGAGRPLAVVEQGTDAAVDTEEYAEVDAELDVLVGVVAAAAVVDDAAVEEGEADDGPAVEADDGVSDELGVAVDAEAEAGNERDAAADAAAAAAGPDAVDDVVGGEADNASVVDSGAVDGPDAAGIAAELEQPWPAHLYFPSPKHC